MVQGKTVIKMDRPLELTSTILYIWFYSLCVIHINILIIKNSNSPSSILMETWYFFSSEFSEKIT